MNEEKVFQTLDKEIKGIKVRGRCAVGKNGVHTVWSDSGIEVSGWFSGAFNVHYSISEGCACFHVLVDNDIDNEKLFLLDSGKDCFEAAKLDPGYHVLRISKADGVATKNVYLCAVEYSGRLDEAPVNKVLNIEVIGDSISCGTGIEAPNGLRDDAFFAYDVRLARTLCANLNIVAIPGWACSKSPDGRKVHLVPNIYEKTASVAGDEEQWDFANHQMDAVIINLCTNDYVAYHDSDRTELRRDVGNFIDTVRKNYPNAHIFWTYGMMDRVFTGDIKEVIAEKHDEKLSFVNVLSHTGGWGHHPEYTAHIEYSKVFEEALISEMGLEEKLKKYRESLAEKYESRF